MSIFIYYTGVLLTVCVLAMRLKHVSLQACGEHVLNFRMFDSSKFCN